MPFGTKPKKKTHEDCRQFLCLFCLKKGDTKLPQYVHKSKPETKSGFIEYIEKELIPNFMEYRSILPGGCCGSCRFIVYDGDV